MKGPLDIGQELCAAWGLDPAKVRSITVSVTPNQMPTVEVVMLVGDEHVQALKRYELYARDAGLEAVA